MFQISSYGIDKSRKIVIDNLNSGKIADITSIFKAFRNEADKRGLNPSTAQSEPSEEKTKSTESDEVSQETGSVDYTTVNRLDILQKMEFQFFRIQEYFHV